MKSIEQLQAEHAAQLVKLQAEHAIAADAAASGFPEPRHVMPFDPYAWLCYAPVKTLADALQVFRVATVAPYFGWRLPAGHLTHGPDSTKGGTRETGPYACGVKVETGSEFGPSAELQFFARLQSGRIVAIHVPFGSGYIGTCPGLGAQKLRRLQDGKRFIRNHDLHALADSCTYWATGTRESHSVLAHWCAESEEPTRGADMAHALGMLQNLSDATGV